MADEPSKNTRTYKVLQSLQPERGYYQQVAEIVASTPTQAITLAVYDFGSGKYVAVPEGNWTEQTYKSEPRPPKITRVEESAAPVAAGDLDIPGEASGVGNEPGAGAADAPAAGDGQPNVAEMDALAAAAEQEPLVEDADYQERKAEIAARRS